MGSSAAEARFSLRRRATSRTARRGRRTISSNHHAARWRDRPARCGVSSERFWPLSAIQRSDAQHHEVADGAQRKRRARPRQLNTSRSAQLVGKANALSNLALEFNVSFASAARRKAMAEELAQQKRRCPPVVRFLVTSPSRAPRRPMAISSLRKQVAYQRARRVVQQTADLIGH